MTLTQASPRSEVEFFEVRATKFWPTPLGRFLPTLVSQAGVVTAVVVGAT